MTFAPIVPTTNVAPTKIASDTYVILQVQPALGQPLFVYINSMVILGAEPSGPKGSVVKGTLYVDVLSRALDVGGEFVALRYEYTVN